MLTHRRGFQYTAILPDQAKITLAVSFRMTTTTQSTQYIYKPSGVTVSVISVHDEGEYLMVRSTTAGKVFFAHKNQLVEQSKEPKTGDINVKRRRGRPAAVSSAVPQPEIQRFNINTSTPDQLTRALKGIGMKTATEIKELQQSLPGERFSKLDQIKTIGGIDWDAVLADDTVYVE